MNRRLALASMLSAMIVSPTSADTPAFTVVKHLSLETKSTPPTFVCLDGITLLDRGRLLHIGRPFENRSTLRLLDLTTLEVRDVTVPETPGPWVPGKDQMVVDKPLFYDTDNGVAGMVLRAGGSVSGDAAYLEWDLRANKVARTLPLSPAKGAYWTSVEAIGYDPERRECYLEIIRCRGGGNLPCKPGGPYDWAVVGVTDKVRSIASWTGPLKPTTKRPYYDPVHHRSMHIEYAECGAEQTTAYLVDLDTGAMRHYALPRVIYGFAFDPDGETGYVYAEQAGTVFALDLVSGDLSPAVRYGTQGQLLSFVAPGTLLLGGARGLHFIDAKTLHQTGYLAVSAFHQGSPHCEGSIVMPGRALVRNFSDLYVIDFPGLSARDR